MKVRVGSIGEEKITTLDLRSNLISALRHLRHAETPRVLWIDAICIDQMNTVERNHEVKRMGTIYKMAQRVIVWLGPASDLSTRGLELLAASGGKLLLSRVHLINAPSSSLDDHMSSFPDDIEHRLKRSRTPRRYRYSLDDIRAISDILSRPWWNRLWYVRLKFL